MTSLSSSSAVTHPWLWNIYFCGRHAILPITFVILSLLYAYGSFYSFLSFGTVTLRSPLSSTVLYPLTYSFVGIECMTLIVTVLLRFNKIIWQGIPVSVGIILSGLYSLYIFYGQTTSFAAEKYSPIPATISATTDTVPTSSTINISTDTTHYYPIFRPEKDDLLHYLYPYYRLIEEFVTDLSVRPSTLLDPNILSFSSSRIYLLLPLITGSVLTLISLFIFPPMHLPPLSGKYQTVGTLSDVWERPLQSIFFHKTNGTVRLSNTRKVPVQIYYPSARSKPQYTDRALLWTTGGPNAADQLRAIIYQFTHHLMGLPSWCSSIPLSHFLHARARYCYNVPLNTEQEKWPVIIYSHGLFGWKAYNSYICSELASQGYIVVGVDHIGDSICSYDCSGIPSNDDNLAPANGKSDNSSSVAPSLFTLFTDGIAFTAQSLDAQRKIYTLNAHIRHTDILHVARRLIALSNEEVIRIDEEDSESIQSTSSNDSSSFFSNPRSHISSSNLSPSSSMENILTHTSHVPELSSSSSSSGPRKNTEPDSVSRTAPVASIQIINLLQGHLSTMKGLGILGHSYGGATSILAVSTHGTYGPIPSKSSLSWSLSEEEKEEDEYMHSVHVLREPYYAEGNIATVTGNLSSSSSSSSSASSTATTVTNDRRSYCWYAPYNLREPKFAVGVTLDAFLWGICDGPTLGPNGNPFTGIHSYRDHQACKEAIQKMNGSSTEFTRRIQTVASKYKGAPLLLLNSDKGVWEYELLQIPFMNAIIDRMNLQEAYEHKRNERITKNEWSKETGTSITAATSSSGASSCSSSVAITIPGCGHLNFTDLSLVCHPYLLRKAGRIGPVHPIAVLVDIAQRTGSYFQHHLPVQTGNTEA